MSVSMMTDDDRLVERDGGIGGANEGVGQVGYLSIGDTDAEFDIDIDALTEMRRNEERIRTEQEEEERRRLQKEQQIALQQRAMEQQLQQLAQQRMQRQQSGGAEPTSSTSSSSAVLSDEEGGAIDVARLDRGLSNLSTLSTTSTASADTSAAGWITVVGVHIQPHRPSSPPSAPSSPSLPSSPLFPPSDPPLVDVRFHVFRRFVPTLTLPSPHIARVSERHQSYIKQMEDEDGYSSGTSSHGANDIDDDDDDDDDDDATAQPLTLTGNREIDGATLRRLIGMADEDSDDDDDQQPPVPHVHSTRSTMQGDEEGDDEDEEGVRAGPLRTKNELPETALPPVLPFTVSEGDRVQWCGVVQALVDGMLIVQCQLGGRALDVGSAICLENRTPVGRVEEVFGPVTEPLYSIRPLADFDLTKSAPERGAKVYSVQAQSSYVMPDTTPGTDASNPYDEEVEAEMQDFSDDDKECEAKQKKKRGKTNRMTHPQQRQTHQQHLPSVSPSPRSQAARPAPPPPQSHSPRSFPPAPSPYYGHPSPYAAYSHPPYGYPAAAHPAYAQHWAAQHPQQQSAPAGYPPYDPALGPYYPPRPYYAPAPYGPPPPPPPPPPASYFSPH